MVHDVLIGLYVLRIEFILKDIDVPDPAIILRTRRKGHRSGGKCVEQLKEKREDSRSRSICALSLNVHEECLLLLARRYQSFHGP